MSIQPLPLSVRSWSVRIWLPALALLVSLGAMGCTTASSLTVPLQYRPTSMVQMGSFAGQLPTGNDAKVFVTVTDARTDKGQIGENAEDSPKMVPVYAGVPAPAEFLREALNRELSKAGLNVVSNANDATRGVTLDLTRFWCEESDTYRTEIVADAKVTNAAATLWQGRINGSNSRFGRSLSTENYQESFSDSAVMLIQNLLSNPGFQAALKK